MSYYPMRKWFAQLSQSPSLNTLKSACYNDTYMWIKRRESQNNKVVPVKYTNNQNEIALLGHYPWGFVRRNVESTVGKLKLNGSGALLHLGQLNWINGTQQIPHHRLTVIVRPFSMKYNAGITSVEKNVQP